MAYHADIYASMTLFIGNKEGTSKGASPEVQECSGKFRNILPSHQILQGRVCPSSHPRYQHLTAMPSLWRIATDIDRINVFLFLKLRKISH